MVGKWTMVMVMSGEPRSGGWNGSKDGLDLKMGDGRW